MPRPAAPPRTGPRALTDERRKLLLDSLAAGDSIKAAAETAHLGERTVQRYLTRGDTAQATLDTHIDNLTDTRRTILDRWDDTRRDRYYEHHIPPTERAYWRLWRDATRARARAETLALARIRAAGAGGGVSWKEVLNPKTGEKVRLEQSIDPDWRAEAWFLQHGHARERWYRRPTAVELTGADGGPIALAGVDEARDRAAVALSKFEQRRNQALEAERQAAAEADSAGDALRTGSDPGGV